MLNERNEKLDEIGRRFARRNALSENDLEKIVAAPRMWQNVRRQIEAEKLSRREQTNVFASWDNIFGVHQNAFRLAFATIFIVGATFGLWIFASQFELSDNFRTAGVSGVNAPEIFAENKVKPKPESVEIVPSQIPQNEKAIAKPTQIKFTSDNSPRSNKSRIIVNKQVVRIVKPVENKIASRREVSKTPYQTPNADVEQQSEFYALSFAENSNANEMKQIVRVKLSPAALIKLGVSNSLATIDSSVTADLLLGEDGSPQAIRFIR